MAMLHQQLQQQQAQMRAQQQHLPPPAQHGYAYAPQMQQAYAPQHGFATLARQQPGPRRMGACYVCGVGGHMAATCPKRARGGEEKVEPAVPQ
jgi:hypothetical protein